MSIGNQATTEALDNLLTQVTTGLRNICTLIRQQNTYITNLGVSGLETIGFDSTDAAAYLAAWSYLATVEEVYYGTQGQAAAGQAAVDFNFDNELSQYWGGQ